MSGTSVFFRFFGGGGGGGGGGIGQYAYFWRVPSVGALKFSPAWVFRCILKRRYAVLSAYLVPRPPNNKVTAVCYRGFLPGGSRGGGFRRVQAPRFLLCAEIRARAQRAIYKGYSVGTKKMASSFLKWYAEVGDLKWSTPTPRGLVVFPFQGDADGRSSLHHLQRLPQGIVGASGYARRSQRRHVYRIQVQYRTSSPENSQGCASYLRVVVGAGVGVSFCAKCLSFMKGKEDDP